jgi:Domain of unknown function (DUF5664)
VSEEKPKIGKVGGAKRLTEYIRSLKNNESGLKYDSGKSPLSLIPGSGLRAIGEVLSYGKKKYNAHNWRKGIEHSRLLDAAMRHLSYVCDGELIDKESGLRHLAHAATNLIFLLDMQETHPELDDLYTKPIVRDFNSTRCSRKHGIHYFDKEEIYCNCGATR